jgi:hypothetical protein
LVCLVDVLPALNSLEKAEISQDNSGSSCDSRGAVDVNSVAFIIHHIVKVLGCCKNFHLVLFFVYLLDWIVDSSLDSLG